MERNDAIKISLDNIEIEDTPADMRPLRIAVFPMFSPETTMEFNQDFFAYLSRKMGTEIELVQRGNPDEINYLLETRDIDAAFVNYAEYIEGHDEFGMKLIAVAAIDDDFYCYSYVIVPANSTTKTLQDLYGKQFAFSTYRFSQNSVVPEYILNTINSSPDEFFSGYRYSTSQDKFVEDIANERLDGAEISEIVLHYMKLKDPSIVPKIRIIATSPEKPSPVFVVHPSADTEFSYLLTNSLTSMNEQAEGRQILKQMGIDMFVELDHSYYVNESLIS